MLIFGEIVSFETPMTDSSVDDQSAIFILFNAPGRGAESTVVSHGISGRVAVGTTIHSKRVFVFNRPITHMEGQRLVLQVIQSMWTGGQKIIGYGYCDLELNKGSNSRDFEVVLWRPKAPDERRNELCGTFSPLSDPELVTLPACVDRSSFETVSHLGRVKIHIQRSGYC